MDPISIGLLLGSTALGGFAGMADKKAQSKFQIANLLADQQQFKQDVAEANARNQVLGRYRETARGFGRENQQNFSEGLGGFMPDAQGAAMASNTAARGSAIDNALGQATTVADIPLRAGAPQVVRDQTSAALGDAFERSKTRGAGMAALGSYGDTQKDNMFKAADTGQRVETVNTLARGNAALLPAEQDLVGFQHRSPIFRPSGPDVPWWVAPAKQLANIGGAVAGSNMLGSWFPSGGSMAPASAGFYGGSPSSNPLLNPSTYRNYA